MADTNPPPLFIPRGFLNEREYFQELHRFLFLLWQRTGGGTDNFDTIGGDLGDIEDDIADLNNDLGFLEHRVFGTNRPAQFSDTQAYSVSDYVVHPDDPQNYYRAWRTNGPGVFNGNDWQVVALNDTYDDPKYRLYDSISQVSQDELKGENSVQTVSFFDGLGRGGSVYARDGTTGLASTLYADNSGFYDALGQGFKLSNATSVTQYGARGDDSTDDVIPLNYAFAALNSGEISALKIDDGLSFRVTNEVLLSATDALVYGTGAIRAINGSWVGNRAILSVVSCTNVTIRDVTVNANFVGNSRAIFCQTTNTNIVIDGVTVNRAIQGCIWFEGFVDNITVQNCRMISAGFGVWVQDTDAGSQGFYAYNNYCRFDQATGTGQGIGINCPTNGFTEGVISGNRVIGYLSSVVDAPAGIAVARGTAVTIDSNVLVDNEGDGIHLEDNADRCVVSNNIVKNIINAGFNSNGISVYNSDGCVIDGNVVSLVSDRHGIALDGSNDTVSGVGSQALQRGNIVTNNRIQSAARAGIILSSQYNCIVEGNYILDANTSAGSFGGIDERRVNGAVITVDNRDIKIHGNIVQDDTSTTAAGILISAESLRGSIKDNDSHQTANPIVDNSGLKDIRNNRTGTNILFSLFTLTNGATSITVNNNNVFDIAHIDIRPTSATAAAIQAYVSAVVPGVSFTVTHLSAAGTETFRYQML